jgi:uracil-DNA glycosylase family 4
MDKSKELKKLNRRMRMTLDPIFDDPAKVWICGEGNPDAALMLVGEAPGREEVRLGRPFVGQAGKNLDEFLGMLGIEREEIYITNAVKFRPVKVNPETGRVSNRTPSREETALCAGWLFQEIAIIEPRIVVTLGNIPLRVITDDGRSVIGAMHGCLHHLEIGPQKQSIALFPLYHPASIIYRRELKPVYEADIRELKRLLPG